MKKHTRQQIFWQENNFLVRPWFVLLFIQQFNCWMNRVHHIQVGGHETIAQNVRKAYQELFFSAKERWREKTLSDDRQALKGIIQVRNLIGV